LLEQKEAIPIAIGTRTNTNIKF